MAGRGLRSKPPGEENLEILTQNRANPVPYYLPGDVLLVHSLRRPLASTIPPKKAVVGLGLCATLSDMLCVSKTAGVCLKSLKACAVFPLPPQPERYEIWFWRSANKTGERAQLEVFLELPKLFL